MRTAPRSSGPVRGLDALLARSRPVLLDGAVGTELARRGVDTTLPLWSARALFDERGLATLTRIHQDYAQAGAEILVTNTFRTTARALARAGRAAEWRAANRRAVECARAGAGAAGAAAAGIEMAGDTTAGPGRTCLVAGGLAPLEDCYRPDLVPAPEECLAEHTRQAELLASLRVDLLFIETMNRLVEAEAALAAARGTGLPILLSLCPKSPAHLLSGEPLSEALPRLEAAGGGALRGFLLNCAAPEALEDIFPRFVSYDTALPRGLYAHLGEPDGTTGWRLPKTQEPARYAAWIESRLEEGARLVGGCCGTTPDHIAAIAARIEERAS